MPRTPASPPSSPPRGLPANPAPPSPRPYDRPLLAAAVLVAAAVLAASTAVQTSAYAIYHDELWNHPAAVSLLLAVAGMAAVPGLNRPWHYLMLHPFLVVAAFFGFSALTGWLGERGRIAKGAVIALAVAVALAAAREGARTVELLSFLRRHRGAHMYSPGLYELHRYLQRLAPQRLICLKYSLCNPLSVLAGGRVERVDLTWTELSDATEQFVRYLLSLPGTVVVYRQVSGAAGPAQAAHFAFSNRTSDWLLPRLLDAGGLARSVVYQQAGVEFGVVLAGQGG